MRIFWNPAVWLLARLRTMAVRMMRMPQTFLPVQTIASQSEIHFGAVHYQSRK